MDPDTYDTIFKAAWSLWLEVGSVKEVKGSEVDRLPSFDKCFQRAAAIHDAYRRDHVSDRG